MTMHAVVFAAPRRIEVEASADPRPGPGEVLVQAECSAISGGTEMLLYRGQMPPGLTADATLPGLDHDVTYPMRYGYAMVGRVVGLGETVDATWADQRVFAFHPHESRFVTPPERVVSVPPTLESENAVFLANMETAVNLLHDGRPLAGERVLVLGQGIVGLLLTQLLSRFPLAGLDTVDPLPARRLASVDAGTHAAAASIENVRGSEGFDLVYELSGHPAALNDAIAAARFSGRVVIGSWYGSKRAEIDLGGVFHRSRISLVSSQVSTIDPSLRGAWSKERRLRFAMSMLSETRPARFITHRVPAQRAAEAYALVDERPQEVLQAVLTWS